MRAGLLALILVAGCGRPFEPATPKEFVELKKQAPTYDYRSTTADGVVLAARAIDKDPGGEASFWLRAIENQLRRQGGYALLDSKPTACKKLKGTVMRFGHDEGQKPHLYVVAVFVTDSRIFLLEAGGGKDAVERYAEQIDWFIKNFDPSP